MSNSLNLGLSAQRALEQRLSTIANNLANAQTAGFRAERVKYASKTSFDSLPEASFASVGETYLSRESGSVVRTGNPLDVAIDGDAWIGVATPQGTAYSRDGRLQITPTGELKTLTGHDVLDAGGSPIRLDPAGETPSIARDGTVTQGKTRAGTVGLFRIDAHARISRAADSTVIPSTPAIPAVDNPLIGLRQGFVENSNVNPITEMSRLILNQRLFEAVSGVLNDVDQLKTESIRTLGSPS